MQPWPRIVLMVSSIALVFLVQCSDDDEGPMGTGGAAGYETRFELTPTPASGSVEKASVQTTIIERYLYHCNDQAVPECITYVFEDVPDESGDWMSFPTSDPTCIPFFAEVNYGGMHYSFTGDVVRSFGQGTGPFVTGSYQVTDGTNFEFGSFSFYEQQLTFGDIAFCGAAASSEPWQRVIGGPEHDKAHAIAVDRFGNVFVTGTFNGRVDFGGQMLDSADGLVFVAKYDASGELSWVTQVSGGVGVDGPLNLGTDEAGNVVLQGIFIRNCTFGATTLTNTGGEHVFVVKYDPWGGVLWAEQDTAPYLSVGFDMAMGPSGNTAVAGFIKAGATFGETDLTVQGFDFFVVEYDASGHALWARQSAAPSQAEGYAVTIDGAGNVAVAGGFWGTVTFGDIELTSSGSRDAFIVKYDNEGNVLWANRMGEEYDDNAGGLVSNSNGNLIMMGRLWGTTTNLWNYGADGTLLWEASALTATRIAIDPSDNIVLAGSFGTTVTVGSSEITSHGARDIFVAAYDTAGKGLWAASGGGPFDDRPRGIAVDRWGAPVVVGDFAESFTFGDSTLPGQGSQDVIVLKLEPPAQ